MTFWENSYNIILGDLRDRDQGRILEELTKFANYIANDLGWLIEENATMINDEGLYIEDGTGEFKGEPIYLDLNDLVEVKNED